jgi:uncharacterized protein (TIGR02145 family)
MNTIKRLITIFLIMGILVHLSCGVKAPSQPQKPSSVKINFKFVGKTSSQSLILGRSGSIISKKKQKQTSADKDVLKKTMIPESIDQVQVVFYKLDIDYETLGHNYDENWNEIDAFIDNFEGDETDFEGFWVTRDQGEINMASEGQYGIEKRGNLSVSGGRAYGEFDLTEGLKACRVGCFENGRLTYVGRTDGLEGSGYFQVLSGENNEIDIDIWEIEYEQSTAPTASFTLSPTSGTTETQFSFDASGSWDDEDDVSLLQMRWDWENDGIWDTNYSTTKTATHQYSTEGTKTIKLEVRDTEYYTDQTTRQVTVSEQSAQTGTMTDIDGNTYQTVKIGNQWWMAENLKVTHYRNGDPIPNVTGDIDWANLTTGAYCAYDNDENNADTYGYLYNWYAVDDRGEIAPDGWHVPTDDEWKELEMYLGMSQSNADGVGWRGTNEGGKLKETGSEHWNNPNTGATNESGFSALPLGDRTDIGSFNNLRSYAIFWSSSAYQSISAYSRKLIYNQSNVYRDPDVNNRGYAIRCIKD